MREVGFEAQLMEGHKGVTTVLVPFDAEDVWGSKTKAAPEQGSTRRAEAPRYLGESFRIAVALPQ